MNVVTCYELYHSSNHYCWSFGGRVLGRYVRSRRATTIIWLIGAVLVHMNSLFDPVYLNCLQPGSSYKPNFAVRRPDDVVRL